MSSGSEALAKKIPEARVVCAFNTIPSEALFGVFAARREPEQAQSRLSRGRCAQQESCCRAHPRRGFEPVDAGPLRIARYTEPFALLMGQLAYEGKDGPELAYRFERSASE